MKHIGIVVPSFPVASETFVVTEIKGLMKAGHKVTVFCFGFNKDTKVALPDDLTVIDLKASQDPSITFLLSNGLLALFRTLRVCFRQKGAFRLSLFRYGARLGMAAVEHGCEHLHSHFMGPSLAHSVIAGNLFSLGVSSVGHGHDIYQTPVDLAVKLRECQFAVAVCEDMQSRLRALTNRSVALIHCGVDVTQFAVHPRPQNTNLKLLFIGRLVEKKGLSIALEAIAALPPLLRPTLDIVGDGPLRLSLEQQCVALGIDTNVNFKGFRPPEWLQRETANYDALIAPFCEASNGDRDTGPVVLKESMAMGIPVITTRFMGCEEIVSHESGWLVESKNAAQLRHAIEQLWQASNTEIRIMRQAARNRVEEHFCYIKQAAKLSALIESAECHVSH
ncbi:glycosyltransferase [Aestuariibacter salexigens]|uniref:glycosyltransferase n=1 Tax=Aestuariibacter salexigens TaxID=226010 RepID=UPI0004128586|nr:glycosyltransferase [Aestuariibacter salexigens]